MTAPTPADVVMTREQGARLDRIARYRQTLGARADEHPTEGDPKTVAEVMADIEELLDRTGTTTLAQRIDATHKAVDRLVGTAATYGKTATPGNRTRLGARLRETHEALDALVVALRTQEGTPS